MIALHSNVKQVRERFERFHLDLTGYLLKTVETKLWVPIARQEAEQVLRVLARTPFEQEMVSDFVETVLVTVWGAHGMEWTMERVRYGAVNVLEAMKLDRMGPLIQFANIEQARNVGDLIQLWVETPAEEGGKRRDERDAGKTDAQIARGIFMIFFGTDTEGRGKAARALLPHIQAFAINRAGLASGVSDETVQRWFEAVLSAWRERIMEDLPAKIKTQIRLCWKGSKS
jgi:hypothetical protein